MSAQRSKQNTTLRISTYNPELKRKGPGLLLRDILGGKDAQTIAAGNVIAHIAPDILLLTSFDYDHDQHALRAFGDHLRGLGLDYPYHFALPPNIGLATGLDMDGDRWLGTAADAQGFGDFYGQGAMAVLSRYPIDAEQSTDFSALLWRDMPGSKIPFVNGAPFPSADAHAIQRLSSNGHWDVAVQLPDGEVIHLLGSHAGTPAFGGSEGRNIARNFDEVRLWQLYIDGQLDHAPPTKRFVILGDENQDPRDGLGDSNAIRSLITHPRLQDPQPRSRGGTEAATQQGGVNLTQRGDPALDTADWPDVDGPGNLRVDYVLPSVDLTVLDAGVFWPASDDPLHEILGDGDGRASRHALVWVDVAR